jgi:phosphoheptose isomerase
MLSLWATTVYELNNILDGWSDVDFLLEKAGDLLCDTVKTYQKILICGNGGSAADAQHFAAELMGWYENKTRGPVRAVSLTTDTSCITAIANDSSYDQIFARQIYGLGDTGDVLIAITTSGKSKNVIEAIKVAKHIGMKVIVLTGQDGVDMEDCDVIFAVPSVHTSRIQEVHTIILHCLAEDIETLWTKNN